MKRWLGSFLLCLFFVVVITQRHNEGQGNLVAFWHVQNEDEVVLDQLHALLSSPLYRDGMTVKWTHANYSHVPPSQAVLAKLQRTENFTRIKQSLRPHCNKGRRKYTECYEFPTLWELHRWCLTHPLDFVAYIHTKSSKAWRVQMMNAVLGPDAATKCIADCLMRGKVACGTRFLKPKDGPCPPPPGAVWCHFSGNFWWARCDHINTLNPPWHNGLIDEEGWHNGLVDEEGWWGDMRPWGRYFAEWWVLNDVQPAHMQPGTLFGGQWAASFVNHTQLRRQPHVLRPRACNAENDQLNLTRWVNDASKLTRFGLAMVRDLGPEVLRWRTPCVGTYRDVGDLVCKV